MRAVLGLPFPTPVGKRLMLVNLTGRKTGWHYQQPVSYVRHDNVLLTPGGGNWKRNLKPGQPVRLHINGRAQRVTGDLMVVDRGASGRARRCRRPGRACGGQPM